ncbi:DsbA family oxidoreductase [Macrococcus animalis]|uniref:DsbA family oxidoreductase n=1 Tax=Macrococcus animalis TaxID=3395467 RepID=UPI0039BDC863
MKIEFWSDYACPYCYIGEKRLETAIKDLGIEDQVDLEMRSFELDPNASYDVVSTTEDRFAKKYRLTNDGAAARIRAIERLGVKEGIDFKYASTQYTNTMDAHRLTQYANEVGNKALTNLLFDAYFTKNLELSNHDVLKDIAAKAGLDADVVEEILTSNKYEQQVRRDETQVSLMGVQGVPFFLINGEITINGAQNVETFKAALQEAMGNQDEEDIDMTGMSCGIDGC